MNTVLFYVSSSMMKPRLEGKCNEVPEIKIWSQIERDYLWIQDDRSWRGQQVKPLISEDCLRCVRRLWIIQKPRLEKEIVVTSTGFSPGSIISAASERAPTPNLYGIRRPWSSKNRQTDTLVEREQKKCTFNQGLQFKNVPCGRELVPFPTL